MEAHLVEGAFGHRTKPRAGFDANDVGNEEISYLKVFMGRHR
jgi:hypothetical protein